MDIDIVSNMVVNFVLQNPKLAGIAVTLYGVGFVSKLIRSAIEQFVKETPSQDDDKKLAEIKSNKIYKAVAFVLDLFIRFKKPNSK